MFPLRHIFLLLACAGLFHGCAVGVAAITAATLGGAATAMFHDRRSMEIQSQDTAINQQLRALLDQDAALVQAGRISIHAYNGLVLLTGEAYTPTAHQRAEELAKSLSGVRQVYNQVRLIPMTTDTRGIQEQDLYTTTRIKAALTQETGMGVVHTQVTTDNGVSYLMGLLTREEAQAVIEVVRNVEGVRQVVPLFEYVKLVPAS